MTQDPPQPQATAPLDAPSDAASTEARDTYSISAGFVALLQALDISVALTSYQSGMLYLLGRNPKGGLMVNQEHFQKAMGLHYADDTLYMSSLACIYEMKNILRPDQVMDELFSDCFVPRRTHLTGALDTHDVGVTADEEIVFVNTAYNCIATLSEVHSFTPYWTPPFVSAVIAEDRCHLNGMALHDGKPTYVTAISKSDTIDGWRDRRASGGVVIDARSDQIICEGLSMPHSPRVYEGKLWVLNSGTGEFGWITPAQEGTPGQFHPLCFCPGFLRGLAFHDHYAFVGLSKPRYERFEGLALDGKLSAADSEPWCGLQVIDLNTGSCVEWFRIDGQTAELYDVEILPKIRCPKSYSPHSADLYRIITID
ncbi:MAG: TIGR03032 family protein [Pseudomonadota bacterium]